MRLVRVLYPTVALAMLSLLLFATPAGDAQSGEGTPDANGPHTIKTVFLIMLENHNWKGTGASSIDHNIHAPYLNYDLLPMASHPNRYYNPPGNHPSLPNYLWLEAGTNFGLHRDVPPTRFHLSTHEHLVSLLDRAGISWKGYEENISGKVCQLTKWHDPFVFFDDVTNDNDLHSKKCIEHVRPFPELKRDLRRDTVARYNLIVPNICDSMHSECQGENQIQSGDEWLKGIVPDILRSSAYRRNGVLFILFDEAEKGDGPIPLVVLSPLAKGNGYSNNIHYTHGSMLRTLQEIFGVGPLLRGAAKEPDLRDLFTAFP